MGQFKLTDQITLTKYKNGRSIQEMLTQFFIKQGETSPTGDESGWSDTAPSSIQSNETLWIRTKITYLESNGSTTNEYSPSKQGYRDYTWENIKEAQDKLNNLQDQVDGVIDVWYGKGEPSGDNDPSESWTDIEKIRREGDIYYDLDTGNGYRFFKNDNGVFSWTKIQDTEVSALISQIKDLADNKVSIYYGDCPTAAQINDLWFPSDTSPCYKCTVTYTSTTDDRKNNWEIANYNTGNFKIQYISVEGTDEPDDEDAGWGYTMPLFQNGWHIWQRTVILDDNDNIISFSTPVNFTNAYRTISEVKNYYQTTTTKEVPKHDNGRWKTDIKEAQISKENPYLWNFEEIIFSDASESQKTAVTLIGNYTKEGKTIQKVEEYYYVHDSKTTEDLPVFEINNKNGWQSSPPTLTDSNPWLWNIEVIYYSEQQYGAGDDIITPVASDPALIGYKGKDGEEGVGASSVTIEVLPQIINGWIEILQSQQITLTATYFQGITNFSDDSSKNNNISYQWKKNGQNVSGGNQRSLISTLTNEDEEVSYTCECTYDKKLKASETVTFSRRYKSLSYKLNSLNPARRLCTVADDGTKSFDISPANLGLVLYEIIDEHEIETVYAEIFAQTNNGSQRIGYNSDSQSFEFDLQTWYTNNCYENGQEPERLEKTINFFLDASCSTYIGSIEFEDAMPDEYLKFLPAAHNITAAIDNNAMVFDTWGLSLYNGAFTIYNAPTKTLPSGTVVADIANTKPEHRVLYFDSGNGRLVVKGEINSTSGKIGGWSIDGNSLNYLPDKKVVGDAGTMLLCPGGSTSVASIGGSSSTNGWAITVGSTFGVTTAGKLYCNSAEITGVIKATSGKIGSATKYWTLGEGVIYSGADSLGSNVTGTYLGTDGILNRSGANYVKITNGTIYANKADITGKITAEEGYIGSATNGWIIGDGKIYSTGTTGLNSTTAGTYVGTDGILQRKDANNYVKITNGQITAKGANITGEITVTKLTVSSGAAVSGLSSSSLSDSSSIAKKTDIPSVSVTKGTASTSNGITTQKITVNVSGTATEYTAITSGGFLVVDQPKGSQDTTNHSTKYFKVSTDGLLTADNAIIWGEIYATSGKIGGLFLLNQKLFGLTYSSYDTISYRSSGMNTKWENSTNHTLFLWAGAKAGTNSSGNRMSLEEAKALFGASDFKTTEERITGSAKFYVTHDGILHATDGVFSGNITAKEGYIGGTTGWAINGQSLKIEKTKNSFSWPNKVTCNIGQFLDASILNPMNYNDAASWSKAVWGDAVGAEAAKGAFDEVTGIAVSQTWTDTISLKLADRLAIQLLPYGFNLAGKYNDLKVMPTGLYFTSGSEKGYITHDPQGLKFSAKQISLLSQATATYLNVINQLIVRGSEITGSDFRLKKDIIPLNEGTSTYSLRRQVSLEDNYGEIFDQLIPVSYKRLNEENRISYGLIAQQVLEVLEQHGFSEENTDLVHKFSENNEEYYGVTYKNFIALLIHEVQKLKKRVTELENLQSE